MLRPVLQPILQPVLRGVFDAPMRAGAGYAPDIGEAGQLGFGLGVAPPAAVKAGYTPLPGHDDPASPNYGNYQYADGSVMCWIPAFYYRIGSIESPRFVDYGANAVDIAGWASFPSVAAANAAGYALHRAFYDGGEIKAGFFVDKYMCSNNSGVASSIRNGPPLSAHSTHNPLSGLNGSPGDRYYGTIDAAKTRGPQFFPAMRYMHAALALLSLAHGQAATSDAACAWYDSNGVTNFPKGNNNNNFGDVNDSELTFVHDGFAGGNSALTGSGDPFAKTTHNGQDSGVTDLNGNMYEVSPGVTYVAASLSVEGWTNTAPAALTIPDHGLATGDIVMGSMSGREIHNRMWTVTVVDADTVELDTSDGTKWGAYPGGGSVVAGTMYALRPEARAADLTGGNSSVTDAWGLTGLSVHSEPIEPTWRTDFPENGVVRRYGNADEAVFTGALAGDDWTRDALGIPMPEGISGRGTNLFGQDYCYQYVRDQLCPVAGLFWSNGSSAGVWGVTWHHARTLSHTYVGFRAASYL